MSFKWHTLDLKIHNRACLSESDKCFYLMEKESEGYIKSDANNLINNFKKPIERKGKPEWKYKKKAITTLTNYLKNTKFDKNYTIIPAPTSKPRNHPDWDNRIDKVVDGLGTYLTHLHIEKALDTITAHRPSHLGGDRNIESIKSNTVWKGIRNLDPTIDTVFLVDDVLVTGAHFKAWKEIILENSPKVKQVVGLFFALHLWVKE